MLSAFSYGGGHFERLLFRGKAISYFYLKIPLMWLTFGSLSVLFKGLSIFLSRSRVFEKLRGDWLSASLVKVIGLVLSPPFFLKLGLSISLISLLYLSFCILDFSSYLSFSVYFRVIPSFYFSFTSFRILLSSYSFCFSIFSSLAYF
jgi:hypothetical protein